MNLKTSQKGFTIVELLIVIVVIAILAAISIVAYVGIQNNARASERQSDATNIAKVAETYFATESSYPASTAAFNTGSENAKLPANVAVTGTGASGALANTAPSPAISETNGPAKSGDTKTYIVQACDDGGEVHYYDPSDKAAKSIAYGEGC